MKFIHKNHKKLIALLPAFALAFGVFASSARAASRTASRDASRDISQSASLTRILYNNSNGLPTSEANAIVQTANGFIYIGSYGGLIRYDGVSFSKFDASTGITGVVSLFEDSRRRLWIGTNDSGLALYEDGKFTFFDKSSGLSSLSVRSVTEDKDGNIVFGTTEGLGYIDFENGENKAHMLNDPVVGTKYLKRLASAADGVIYGCTLDGIGFRLDELKVTDYFTPEDIGGRHAVCVIPSPECDGTVRVGTGESAVLCGKITEKMRDIREFKIFPAGTSVNINSVVPVNSDEFVVCSDSGIGVLNVSSGSYSPFEDCPMNNSVENMMIDHEGNFWFVSSRQGVMKSVKNEFTDISAAAGLENRVVNTTCVYNGILYIGTDTGLLAVDRQTLKRISDPLTELLDGVRIRCIKSDSAGRLWLCTYGEKGLVCCGSDGGISCFNTDSGLGSDRVRALAELNGGAPGVIAAATGAGVSFIRNGEVVSTLGESDGIENTEILTVCGGDNGKVYLGSDGGGIFIADSSYSRVTKRLGLEDGLRSEVVMRIKKDPKRGGYWIITGNSLAYMENEKITTLNNFPYSNNFDIFFDELDRVWILSSSGIYAAGAERLLSGGELEYNFYDVRCGLPSVATANSRSFLDADGTLYIAGMTGVSAVNINKKHSENGKIKLAVPFAEIDGEPVMIGDDGIVEVPPYCKRLTIYGYALTFGLTNPRLSYMLEGFDSKPVTLSRQEMTPVSYTNLAHGEYRFRLSVIDTMTGGETQTAVVTFIKKKAFFEERWFRSIIILAVVVGLLFLGLFLMRIKNQRLQKKRDEDRIFVNQMIRAFAKCIDFKDKYTNGHSFRVAKYTALIAERMGYTGDRLTDIYNIGLLHDIGKIAVPDSILGKPARLTDEEFEVISKHAEHGYRILKEIESRPELAVGAGYHHEHIDGSGYPFGKTADDIPEVAQIIAVADTFDAMNSTRPYRKQMKMEDIINEMKRISGTQLNSGIVDIFLEIIAEGHLDDDIALADIVKIDDREDDDSDATWD